MAIVTAEKLPAEGLDTLTWSPASSGGDEVPTGQDLVLLVRNSDTASHTLTMTTPVTVSGIQVNDVTRTVAADDIAAVPLVASVYRSPSTQRASLAWDATTGVEFAVLRLPR